MIRKGFLVWSILLLIMSASSAFGSWSYTGKTTTGERLSDGGTSYWINGDTWGSRHFGSTDQLKTGNFSDYETNYTSCYCSKVEYPSGLEYVHQIVTWHFIWQGSEPVPLKARFVVPYDVKYTETQCSTKRKIYTNLSPLDPFANSGHPSYDAIVEVTPIGGNVDIPVEIMAYSLGILPWYRGNTCNFEIFVTSKKPILTNTIPKGATLTRIAPPGRIVSPHSPGNTRFVRGHGGTIEGDDPVDLATGEHLYPAPSDISVYNPYGPGVVYTRNFLSNRAKENYASPGLTVGWVDPYDIRIKSPSTTSWQDLTLTYPNGGTETLHTSYDTSGAPTGDFTVDAGAEYCVTGVPSANIGVWDSFTITFKDQTTWRFDRVANDCYMLSRIGNNMGRYISILRDPSYGNRVISITDDCSPANTLLTFAYSGAYLESLTDIYNRKVVFTYNTAPNTGTICLGSVSQITKSSNNTAPAQYTYGYNDKVGLSFLLITITSPSPTGSGDSIHKVEYDTTCSKVISLVDANGNTTKFTYESPDGTKVQIMDPFGKVESEWKEWFETETGLNKSIATSDAQGYSTFCYYEKSNYPELTTRVVDRMGSKTSFTYDDFGNILTTTDPRGTTTTYAYDYANFKFGRLKSITVGSMPPTKFTYKEPYGLVETVESPKPGSTSDNERVTTAYTYDDLGNILTKTIPGNPDNQTIRYNYTVDGTYTQPAKIGQPLTVTDNLSHTTHFRYDERGNIVRNWDALGNTSDFTYNIVDQLVTSVSPAVTE